MTEKDLQAIVEEQQRQINMLLAELGKGKNKPEKDSFDADRLVTIIHMDDLEKGLYTIVENYRWSKFGEKQRIRLGELERLMPTYRPFFENGILMIVDKDINELFDLDNKKFVNANTYKSIYKLDAGELKKIFESVCPLHQEMIIKHWFSEFVKEQNLEYKDFMKISILNQCSDNLLQRMINDFNDRERAKNKA